jgi:cytochrome c biogenesis protein CcdA
VGSVSHPVVMEGGVFEEDAVAEQSEGCSSVYLAGHPFGLVLVPSVGPLLYGSVTAAITASWSRSRPRVKACRCRRPAARI